MPPPKVEHLFFFFFFFFFPPPRGAFWGGGGGPLAGLEPQGYRRCRPALPNARQASSSKVRRAHLFRSVRNAVARWGSKSDATGVPGPPDPSSWREALLQGLRGVIWR